ncbi:MAG TPA: hypothetical protein VNE16_09695 [Vicinamibacterales bacterium]|nr:hypothetical protein [Vicinamibacterales bacterium]
MKRAVALTVALAGLIAPVLAGAPSFHVTPPAVIIDVDGHTLKGDPVQLAWGNTEGRFYVQTVQGYQPKVVFRHYTITLGDKAPVGVKTEPAWASTYWSWKSTRNAPADPNLLIDVRSRVDANRIPIMSLADKAAAMSSGGGQLALQGAEAAGNDRQNAVKVRMLLLKGTTIGQFYNAPLLPGLTFGWSPKALHAVAYVDTHGRLAIFDYLLGAKQVVDGTRNVLLPAWSPDGTKIVFLQKTGDKRYTLEQVNVTRG